MTMNGVIALIMRLSPNLIALLAKYVTLVEYKDVNESRNARVSKEILVLEN